MTDKEQYKKVFDKVTSFGMEPLEVYRLMQKKRKHTYIHKAAAAAAAAALIVCSTGVAYAANVGGIQRTIQLWVHGDQTNAELVIEDGHYSYSVSYQEDGSAQTISGGGVAIEDDGTERPLTEEEIMTELYMPEVEYKEDGTVWVYYYNQKIDVTDSFEDGVCYVKLVNGDETRYLTIKYDDGYSVSSQKYPSPDSFN